MFAGALWHRYVTSGLLADAVHQTVVTSLSRRFGRQVSLGSISGDVFHGIVLQELRIAAPGGFDHGVAFSADRIRVTLNPDRLLRVHPDLIGSVVRIDLVRPYLELSRDAAGSWDTSDLLAAGHGAVPGSGFRGRVVVQDGSLLFADSWRVSDPPFLARFARIAGTAEFGPGDQIALTFSGWSPANEEMTLGGRYRPQARTADLDLTVANGDVAHWAKRFVHLRGVEWSGGRFGGVVRVSLAPSEAPRMDFAATLHIHDADVQYVPGHLWMRHISGPLTVDNMHVAATGLTLLANGSPVWAEGDLVYDGGPWLQLDIKSDNLDLTTVRTLFFPKARPVLAGQAAGEVRVTGPIGALDVDGEIASAQGQLDRQRFDALRTRFQYAGGTLTLTELKAAVGGGRLAGDVVVNVAQKTPSYLFSGSTEHVDVHALTSAGLPGLDGVTGDVSGHVVGAGTGSRVQLMADVTMGPGSLHGVAFDALQALFWKDAGSLDVDTLSARVGSATVSTSGHIDTAGALDLNVWAHDLSLAKIGEQAGVGADSLSGLVDLQGHATGTADSPVFSGTVTAQDGRVGPIAFDLAHGDLTATPLGVQTQHLVIQDGTTQYKVSGGLMFHPLAAADLHIEAQGVDAGELAGSLPALPGITGSLAMDLTIDGPFAQPSLTGRLSLDDGSVAGTPIDHAEAHLSMDGRLVRLTDTEMRLRDSRVFAAGTIDPQGPIDLQLWARDVPLADLDAALGIGLSARGNVSLSGGVRGTLRVPEVYGLLWSTDLNAGGEIFDASGSLDYQKGVLRLSSVQLVSRGERYALSGAVLLGPRPSGDLTLSVDQGRLATLLHVAQITPPAPLDGTINGRVTLSGPLADPAAHLALTLRDAQFGEYAIGTGVADLTLTHQAIDIRRFEIHPEQGLLQAEGRVDLRGESAVEISAEGLNPDFLRPFFRADRPLEGTLNFTLQFNGQIQDPTVGLSFEALNAGIGDVVADRIAGLAYYKEGTLNIEEGVIAKGPHKLAVVGTLPIRPESFDLDPQAPVSLRFTLQDADLSLLTLLTPQIQDAAGTVEGEVNVWGKVADPQMSGYLRSSSGRLRYTPLRTPIEDVSVDLAFSQDEIQVHDISGTLGNGRAQVNGVIGVRDLRPGDVQLTASARDVTVDLPGAYKGQVDAELQVTGPAVQPTASGTISLSHGQVTAVSGFGGGGGGPIGRNLKLDTTLNLGPSVALTAGAVRADLEGGLHIGGTLAKPALAGTVTSSSGQISLLGSVFNLTEGEAVFSESLEAPMIYAHAQAAYGATLVFLDVSGLASHPDLTLSSDPPMAEQDVTALVARNAGIAGDPTMILGQGVGRALLAPVGQALHLDELSIAYSGDSPLTLRVGKFVLPHVYMTVSEVVSVGPPGATVVGVPFAATNYSALTPSSLTTRPYAYQSYVLFGLGYLLSPSLSVDTFVDTLGGTGVFLVDRFPL